jgi:hypothetical protein
LNYTLFDLFLNAYNGNSFAQLQIVQRFQPLLKNMQLFLSMRMPIQIYNYIFSNYCIPEN